MAIARRDFLKVIGSASVAGGLSTASAQAFAATGAAQPFGFTDENVPMNAANLCPMPVSVSRAHERFAQALDLSLSPESRSSVVAFKENARDRLATMLGTSADELAIVRNTSEANNTIVQGFPLQEGDEVVLWDQNHPSNSVAWEVQAARAGATVRRFSVPVSTGSIDEVVDLFVDAVSDRTRVVAFTHISNITGFRTPLPEICAALRRRKDDLFIHVDGAQTWGAVDVNLGEIEADSFSGSAHKWFMGPREVGLLYVRDRHIDAIWPNIVSIPWGRTAEDAPAGARKFDALGQRDDAAIASLGDAVRFHEEMTPAGVEQRSAEIANRLRAGLEALGVPFVSSKNPAFASSVIILKAAREKASGLVQSVYEQSGIITAPAGGLRMSPHVYNTDDHVDRVLHAVENVRSSLG